MINAAAGTPQYSGTFIPEIWSGKLLVKFYEATVIAAISNTDYEGEIKNQGDKVIIRQVPDITIRDYVKGQSLQIERPEAPNKELPIDRAKYFNFICDDIDEIKERLELTRSENQKMSQAITSIEKARNILTQLFPNIKSLKSDVREDLETEFADIC